RAGHSEDTSDTHIGDGPRHGRGFWSSPGRVTDREYDRRGRCFLPKHLRKRLTSYRKMLTALREVYFSRASVSGHANCANWPAQSLMHLPVISIRTGFNMSRPGLFHGLQAAADHLRFLAKVHRLYRNRSAID